MSFWLYQGNAGEMALPENGVPYPTLEAAIAAREKMFAVIAQIEDGITPSTGMIVPFRHVWYYTPACGWYFWDTEILPTTINQWDCTNPLATIIFPKEQQNAD